MRSIESAVPDPKARPLAAHLINEHGNTELLGSMIGDEWDHAGLSYMHEGDHDDADDGVVVKGMTPHERDQVGTGSEIAPHIQHLFRDRR